MKTIIDPRTREFAQAHGLQQLTESSLVRLLARDADYSIAKGRCFLEFQQRIDEELLLHRVITGNTYTRWFKRGEQSWDQVRAFIVQFSVFSNLFLLAQLHKMLNADSLEEMRSSKEILANEIGVVFNPNRRQAAANNVEQQGDPDLVATEGSVDGGLFRFRAAHFEWLLQIAAMLGLSFKEVGKRRHGIPATLFFCDELVRLYGSADYAISQAASYAVENWAAAGFWEELIEGLSRFNEQTGAGLPLAFFTWHNRLEAQHARHTQEELEAIYFRGQINEDAFIRHGNEMLDGVAAFWDGLDDQRRQIALAA
ncbi:MAG: hypothetical protein ACREX4_07065 [Gammaproteobacteria bacterium]